MAVGYWVMLIKLHFQLESMKLFFGNFFRGVCHGFQVQVKVM